MKTESGWKLHHLHMLHYSTTRSSTEEIPPAHKMIHSPITSQGYVKQPPHPPKKKKKKQQTKKSGKRKGQLNFACPIQLLKCFCKQ